MDGQETQTAGGNVKVQIRGGVTWVDVQNPGSAVFQQLERDYHLHPLHLSESIQKVQHTEVEHEDNYLFLVLHYPVFESRTDKIAVGQVGVFLGQDYLITVHTEPSLLIADVFKRYGQDQETDKDDWQSSAYLLYVLIGKLLANIAGMAETVEAELDEIEGLVFENSKSDAERIGRVRQKITRLRRLIGPKRILLQDLAERIDSFTGQDMSKYYSNNVKTANKLWEVVEEAKETIEIFKDADFTTSAEQTNKTLSVLTLVFTYTIPVTVVASLYGMNVPLPGGVTSHVWTFLGRYTTFGLALALSSLIALAMYLYFKRKKWF